MWKMKITKNAVILSLVALLSLGGVVLVVAEEPILPNAKDVYLAPNAIGIPLGRILMVRKDNEYCAVKFTQCLTGKTDHDQHAEYESYYQGDKTGSFYNRNVKYVKEEVYYTKQSLSIFGHPIRIGAKKDICCGPIELWWSGLKCVTAVYFNRHDQKQGDFYGIELAPTLWTDIKEVNLNDPRIKWYRYDENRKRVNIPIDQLWENTQENK
jgi:hypothetical protein